jgi:hypothetical protein
VGEVGEQSLVLLRIMRQRSAAELHSGCSNDEGSVGKPEEGFRRDYDDQEA